MICVAFGILATILSAGRTGATLSGTTKSLEMDVRSLSVEQGNTITANNYEILEMSTGANRVREYLSPSGVVFGAGWDGTLDYADIDRLLGPYAEEYEEVVRSTPRVPASLQNGESDGCCSRNVGDLWGILTDGRMPRNWSSRRARERHLK